MVLPAGTEIESRTYCVGGETVCELADPAMLRAVSERLRLSVRDAPMDLETGPLALTLSLGVAFYDGREAVTAQVVVDRADRALYRAKRAGRDRVAQWERGLDDEARRAAAQGLIATLRAEKPLLRRLSFALKPIFSWNHRWAMARGYENLRREVNRRLTSRAEAA